MFEAVMAGSHCRTRHTPLIIGALYVALWPRVESQIEADDNI